MTMIMRLFVVVVSLVLAPQLFAGPMQEMDDLALAKVDAFDGISVRMELLINAKSDGTALTASTPGSYIDCPDPSDPCRFAIGFQGRTDKWIVMKGFYGIMRVNDIRLDAQTSLAAVGSNAAYFKAAKFQSATGACLLYGGCTSGVVGTMPALRISYPAVTLAYDPVAKTSSGFSSAEVGATLTGMAAEFGPTGYLNDAKGSFLGAAVRDLNGPTAGIAFKGNAYVYGF